MATKPEQVLSGFGDLFLAALANLGENLFFGIEVILKFSSLPFRIRKSLHELYEQGVASLSVILATSAVTGMVLALQLVTTLNRFGAETKTPQVLAISLVRELGPVLAALMFVGKAGGRMASELGTMSVNEQIKALRVMAIDPINYLIVNRVMAAMICVPILVTVFDLVGIFAGGFMMSLQEEITLRYYFNQTLEVLKMSDFIGGWIKALVFGLVVSLICCFKGFTARGGSQGVGRATTQAVATGSIMIILLDLLLTKFNMVLID